MPLKFTGIRCFAHFFQDRFYRRLRYISADRMIDGTSQCWIYGRICRSASLYENEIQEWKGRTQSHVIGSNLGRPVERCAFVVWLTSSESYLWTFWYAGYFAIWSGPSMQPPMFGNCAAKSSSAMRTTATNWSSTALRQEFVSNDSEKHLEFNLKI